MRASSNHGLDRGSLEGSLVVLSGYLSSCRGCRHLQMGVRGSEVVIARLSGDIPFWKYAMCGLDQRDSFAKNILLIADLLTYEVR